MSEEIRVRVDVRDVFEREYTCEVSSSSGVGVATSGCGSQLELVRLLAEAFRVLAHHLVAPPDDHLLLEKFSEAAFDWEVKVRDTEELLDEIRKQFED